MLFSSLFLLSVVRLYVSTIFSFCDFFVLSFFVCFLCLLCVVSSSSLIPHRFPDSISRGFQDPISNPLEPLTKRLNVLSKIIGTVPEDTIKSSASTNTHYSQGVIHSSRPEDSNFLNSRQQSKTLKLLYSNQSFQASLFCDYFFLAFIRFIILFAFFYFVFF